MEITDRISEVVESFSKYSDWEDRYKHLIDYGKKLQPMNPIHQIDENKIKGCQSQVWLHAEIIDGRVVLSADSDASIVKGIVALLVHVYSTSTPDEILGTKPDFIEKIGLKEHLSMSRANGLNSMIKQIAFYGMAFKAKQMMK
jgi:cysteine desulfuration protein SufE